MSAYIIHVSFSWYVLFVDWPRVSRMLMTLYRLLQLSCGCCCCCCRCCRLLWRQLFFCVFYYFFFFFLKNATQSRVQYLLFLFQLCILSTVVDGAWRCYEIQLRQTASARPVHTNTQAVVSCINHYNCLWISEIKLFTLHTHTHIASTDFIIIFQ